MSKLVGWSRIFQNCAKTRHKLKNLYTYFFSLSFSALKDMKSLFSNPKFPRYFFGPLLFSLFSFLKDHERYGDPRWLLFLIFCFSKTSRLFFSFLVCNLFSLFNYSFYSNEKAFRTFATRAHLKVVLLHSVSIFSCSVLLNFAFFATFRTYYCCHRHHWEFCFWLCMGQVFLVSHCLMLLTMSLSQWYALILVWA